MQSWADRIERWRRFAEWESDHLRGSPPDFATALAWMSEAWELARRHDPAWSAPHLDEGHLESLGAMRAALGRIRTA